MSGATYLDLDLDLADLLPPADEVVSPSGRQLFFVHSFHHENTFVMCAHRLGHRMDVHSGVCSSTTFNSYLLLIVPCRKALSFHTRMGQQLSCLLTLTNNSSSHTHSTSLPASPLANRSSYGLSASLPASPFAASCPVTPLPPVQYTQPNLRSCSSVEPAASPSSRSALSGFHSGISISATRGSPAHSCE